MSDEGKDRAAASAVRTDDGEPPSAASPAVVVAPDLRIDVKEVFFPNLFKRQNQEGKWAALPEDILSQIGDKLLAEDVLHYISFRGVCRDWRQSTADPVNTERRFRPRNWVLLFRGSPLPAPFDCLDAKPKLSEQLLHRFISMSSGEYVRAHIPELHDHFVCGSVDGLLILFPGRSADTFLEQCRGRDICTRLLNPFTGSMTEYPGMSNFYDLYPISFAASSSSILVATSMMLVAYAKPGENKWKTIAQTHCVKKRPGVFFQERLHGCTFRGDLLQFELEEQLQDQVELKIKTIMPAQAYESGCVQNGMYLVESDGDLLALRWMQRNRYQYFEIFKVVVRADGVGHEKVTLKPINNLGDRALFIRDRLGSVAVSAVIYPCIKPNAVYCYEDFSDLHPTMYLPKGPRCQTIHASLDPGGYFYWRRKKAQFERNALSILPFIPTASCSTDTGCS